MIIRLATIKDQKEVLVLLNELGEVINDFVCFDPDNIRAHELGKNNYQEAMKRPDRKVFVVEHDGSVIGVATFFLLTDFITGKQFAHIDDFVVKKEWRGKGVGVKLLTYIKHYAKRQRIHTIKLTSSPQLKRAYAFYRKNGGVFTQRVIKFEVE
jgi:GNAT superfamily N-acetyltransferase